MEEFFRIEIPPLTLVVVIAVMTVIYFYVIKKYGNIADTPQLEGAAEQKTEIPFVPPGIDPGKVVVITAAAKAFLDRNKSGRH